MRPKSTILLPFLLFGGILITATVQAAPKINVDERVHFYGVQYLDEVRSVSHTFYLTNEGDETLVITGTHPSCGCTRADLSDQNIEPGGVATLTAEFSFERYTGKDQIRVTVDSNDPDAPSIDLGLQGYVLQKWKADLPEIDFGVVQASSSSQPANIQIIAQRRLDEPEPVIDRIDYDPQRIQVNLVQENTRVVRESYQEKTWRYEVRVLTADKYSNFESASLDFRSGGAPTPVLTLPVKWKVEGDLEVTPRYLNLLKSRYYRGGGVAAGGTDAAARVRIRSKSNFPIAIESLTATPPFRAEVLEVENPGEAWAVVELNSEDPGTYSGVLSIFTNHPEERQFDILLEGKVEVQKANLSANGDFYHFGKVFSARVPEVSHTFTIRNSGRETLNLRLEDVGQLEAALGDAEVAPGSSTTLFVRKELAGIVGPVSDVVVIGSNDFERPRVEFRIQGEVLPYWRIDPPELVFENAVEGKPEIGTAVVEQWFLSWERPKRIRALALNDPQSTIEPGEPKAAYSGLGYGTAETEILVRLNPNGKIGWNETMLQLETVEPNEHPIPRLTVKWNLLGQFRSLPRRVVFSKSQAAGGKKDIKVYTLDESPFQITHFEAPPGMEVQPLKSTPTESFFTVTVTDPTALANQPEPRIVFSSDKADESEFEVEVLLR
ncbi:MAG: DUF1573 domain-containing protein [Candidatus Omnitrophica bacterium]|nr:DUF1573 domain-containing protein [Candidatus Omnitrophota bacterium]